MQTWVARHRKEGKQIGFVPTMGALHYGHMSLVERSKAETDVTVVSIFVNPKQFNDPEDLKKYPRPVEQDLQMLHEGGVDAVFLPEVEEIYPPGENTPIVFDPGSAGETMEGHFRPGHFKGMAEVVYRLLGITSPDYLFMGQKDFQQFAIICKLIADFQMLVSLVMCPTVREPGGLAMSSRNVRLSPQARDRAGIIYKSLSDGKKEFESGKSIRQIQVNALEMLEKANVDPEYFEVVDGFSLNPVGDPGEIRQIVACCAAKVEGIRLIDNMIWKDD